MIEIAQGRLQGHTAGGVTRYLGIPYAGSVSGAGRWRSAPPAPTWSGVREAVAYGPRAPQNPSSTRPEIQALLDVSPPPGWSEAQAEDCLTLNVFTPAEAAGPLPVMVWLHGGGFFGETPPIWWAEGGVLSAEQRVVVVTVRHRVGALGHLHLADLTGRDDLALSGNVAIDDLMQALRWVQANIGAFGGDASNVTLFGESGGGAKVCILMNAPRARGLFHKAIVQSGPTLLFATRQEATETAAFVLKELGLGPGEVERLFDVPSEALLKVQAKLLPGQRSPWETSGKLTGFCPLADGELLPAQPFTPNTAGLWADIPLLIGTNRDEARFLAARPADAFEMTAERMRAIMGRSAGPRLEEAVRVYSGLARSAAPSDVFFAYMSDYMERARSIELAERRVRRGIAPTYMYLLSFESGVLGGKLGAPHLLDIPLVFGRTDLPFAGSSPDRLSVSAQMRAAWGSFARSGAPAHAGLPPWPTYDEAARSTMIFGPRAELARDPARAGRLYWATSQVQPAPLGQAG